ncbi:MAG: ABC transporter ATP-binding protein [Isosphaeraceae bacterium]
MSELAVRVEGLGKQYRLGGPRERYSTLRDRINRLVLAPFRALDRHEERPEPSPPFWALRDVSFEVKRGEVVGIIGRNGAGKSTLLKILSRITEPTEGEVDVHGRVGSLLEVGTGFHQELTGRENVYLNGAILGMRRSEIARRFDEIVAFAEVEKFIDTPVKHYSSGMYMRLAFAVAAHLDPEILVVDEVLAVGDAQFQKKCLGKMGEVARGGRTVIFVSHNMGVINRLCPQAVWLSAGRCVQNGPSEEVIGAYLLADAAMFGARRWDPPDRVPGNDKVRLRAVRILGATGEVTGTLDIRNHFDVEMEIEVLAPTQNFRASVRILTVDGVVVFTSTDQDASWRQQPTCQPGRYRVSCRVPGNLLNVGNYFVTPGADVPFVEVIYFEEQALGFQIEQTGGVSGKYPETWPGIVCPRLDWAIDLIH